MTLITQWFSLFLLLPPKCWNVKHSIGVSPLCGPIMHAYIYMNHRQHHLQVMIQVWRWPFLDCTYFLRLLSTKYMRIPDHNDTLDLKYFMRQSIEAFHKNVMMIPLSSLDRGLKLWLWGIEKRSLTCLSMWSWKGWKFQWASSFVKLIACFLLYVLQRWKHARLI